MMDLSGDKYGRILVIDLNKISKNRGSYWNCVCDCGNEFIANGYDLRAGKRRSCGCERKEKIRGRTINLINQKFGKLTVIEFAYYKKHKACWKCECDCGNEVIVGAIDLKTGNTQTCGCSRKVGRSLEDLDGKKFGRLVAIKIDCIKNGKTYWLCECDCGNEKSIYRNDLISGKTLSCGCLWREKHCHQLDGQRFGRYTVIKQVEKPEHISKSVISSYWLCKCDCGEERIVQGTILVNGKSQSCGCLAREKNSLKQKLSPSVATFNNLYSYYKYNAKKRNLEFKLSKEYFKKLVNLNCYYCGAEPNNIIKSDCDNGDYVYNGIDRANNFLGYIDGNVVPCCIVCNIAKHTMGKDEFFNWIDRIYNHIHSI